MTIQKTKETINKKNVIFNLTNAKKTQNDNINVVECIWGIGNWIGEKKGLIQDSSISL